MNRKDYLKLFDGVKDKFVVEAVQSREGVPRAPRKKYLALIAATVALALLLLGCVAVYLGLQQRKIGEVPVTQKFDVYGKPVDHPEKQWYIATMSGFDNSPAQQASREWNEFQQSYQPVLTNSTDLPEIPNRYEYTYSCFDQTMVEKLTEIAQTYDLELLGTCAVAQAWQREAAFEVLGLTHLVSRDAPAEWSYGACRVYPPYNFICDVRLTLTGESAPWAEEAYCEVHYLRSGYLAPHDTIYYDPETTQEWEHTAPDGTRLQLALSGTDGIVLAQREDSTIVIQMDLAWQQGAFLDEGTPLPTREALEALADCFDYQIVTREAPMEGLQAQFDAIPDPNAMAPEELWNPRYASFAEYLSEYYLWPEMVEYTFHDIDSDGELDLITSYGNGFSIHWLTIRDGLVTDLTGGRGSLRLCEGGIAESRDPVMEQHIYLKILGPDPETGTEMEHIRSVQFSSGQWKIDGEICTEQEAAAAMAEYRPLDLSWRPLTEFPMDEQGTTFADVLEKEGTLSGEALLAFYAEEASTAYWAGEYAWFSLRDINGDGIQDLLLSSDGERIDQACTCKRGRFLTLWGDFYLCQDDMLHSWDQVDRYNEGIIQRHHFHQILGDQVITLYLAHNLSTDIWTDGNYTEISQEEAQAFLNRYPRIEMAMRPINELTS